MDNIRGGRANRMLPVDMTLPRFVMYTEDNMVDHTSKYIYGYRCVNNCIIPVVVVGLYHSIPPIDDQSYRNCKITITVDNHVCEMFEICTDRDGFVDELNMKYVEDDGFEYQLKLHPIDIFGLDDKYLLDDMTGALYAFNGFDKLTYAGYYRHGSVTLFDKQELQNDDDEFNPEISIDDILEGL